MARFMKYLSVTKLLTLLVLATCMCAAQSKHTTEEPTATVCWEGYTDTSATYVVYFRNFAGEDTTWNLLGTTKETEYTVTKSGKKSVVFGVRGVIAGDTSDLHSSLDSTACNVGGCAAACTNGPWYLFWKIKKPSKIAEKKN